MIIKLRVTFTDQNSGNYSEIKHHQSNPDPFNNSNKKEKEKIFSDYWKE